MSFKIKPENFAKRLCNCLVVGMNLLNMGFFFFFFKLFLNLVTEFPYMPYFFYLEIRKKEKEEYVSGIKSNFIFIIKKG